jgi:hypothetical protein
MTVAMRYSYCNTQASASWILTWTIVIRFKRVLQHLLNHKGELGVVRGGSIVDAVPGLELPLALCVEVRLDDASRELSGEETSSTGVAPEHARTHSWHEGS